MNYRPFLAMAAVLVAGCSKPAEESAAAATNAVPPLSASTAPLIPATTAGRPLTYTIVATQGLDEVGLPIIQETTVVQTDNALPTGRLPQTRQFIPSAEQLERLERIRPVQQAPPARQHVSPGKALTQPPPLPTNTFGD